MTAANTAASRRLIHCSLRRASSRLSILRRLEVRIDGCRDLPQASGEGRGSAAAHPKRHGHGLHLPGRDRVVQLERGVVHSGAYAGGEVTDDADDLVPAPGLHILRAAPLLLPA